MKEENERFFDLLSKEDQNNMLEKFEIEREIRRRMRKKGIKEFDSEIDYCNLNLSTHLDSLKQKKPPKSVLNLENTENDPKKNLKNNPTEKLKPSTQFIDKFEKDLPTIEQIYECVLEKTAEKNPKSSEQIWNRLFRPKKTDETILNVIKDIAATKELENCTFQPIINKTNFEGNLLTKTSDKKIEDRLYNDFKERQKKKLIRPITSDLNYIQPKKKNFDQFLNLKNIDEVPLYKKYKQVQQEKVENLENLRKKLDDENSDLKFKPEVNKNSEKIVLTKEQNLKNVVDRLLQSKKTNFAKKILNAEKKNELENIECPFIPEVNQIANEIFLKDNEVYNSDLNFYEKQMIFDEKKRQKVEKLAKEIEPSHVPMINPISRLICESEKNEYLNLDPNQRLYEIPFAKSQALKNEIVKSELEKYSFKPKINEISRSMAKRKSPSELHLYSVEKRSKINDLKNEKIKKEVEECTFAPTINRNFKSVKPVLEKSEINNFLMNLQQNKNFKETIAKKKAEFEMLENCVFKPSINQNGETLKNILHCSSVNSVVKGFDKFLIHVEKAKQIKCEKKERETRIFNLNIDYDYEAHKNPTVPIPFKLSESIRKDTC